MVCEEGLSGDSLRNVADSVMHQLLLGEVTEDLRGVAVSVECSVIRVRFIYEYVSVEEVAAVKAMRMMMCSYFGGDVVVDFRLEVLPWDVYLAFVIDETSVLRPGEWWVFFRREWGDRYIARREERARGIGGAHKVGAFVADTVYGSDVDVACQGDVVRAVEDALEGMVCPHLRGVALFMDVSVARVRFLFDGVTAEDREDVEFIRARVETRLPQDLMVTFIVEDTPSSVRRVLESGERWVYARQERLF